MLADLGRDMDSLLNDDAPRSVGTVFIGGGTPTMLDAEHLHALITGLRAAVNLADGCEITVEANPESTDPGKLEALLDAGVNRLSLGAQSFDDSLLSAIGRAHDARAVERAFENARHAGFTNINMDLMFALPGQSSGQCENDMRRLISLAPEHVSLYQLTLEPNTLFHVRPPTLPGEDEAWRMERRAQEMLAAHGWMRYEVSAYARPGYECAHNLNYWRFGDYLGIGAGAHGKWTGAGRCLRTVKKRSPDHYLRGVEEGFVSSTRHVAGTDLIFEFMLNAMRLVDGFERSLFAAATGLPFSSLAAPLERLETRGLVEITPVRVRPTASGLRFLNDVQGEFLPKSNDHARIMPQVKSTAPS